MKDDSSILHSLQDGEKLDSETIERLIPGADVVGNQLRISRTRVADSGRYTCTATNEAGVAEQDISVYIMSEAGVVDGCVHYHA